MYIATFYSFRGGVGRTTALVNVGLELARRGRKVLLADFDLESPDLTNFAPLAPPEPHAGIVEYVAAYREKGESPDVTEYLYPAAMDGQKGCLWVMPAGRGHPSYWKGVVRIGAEEDEEDGAEEAGDPAYWYWEALAGIDWQGLYDRQEGYLFFEDLRAQWEQLGPDYVLIDTHAGITPALGISTRQLADAVVMMFNPHHNRVGLDEVSWQIQEETEQTGRKPIEQFFVASGVVDADEGSLREEPNREYETGFGFFALIAQIPFSHRLLLGERVIVGKDAEGRLTQEYRRLANALIAANFAKDRDGALLLLRKIHADPSTVMR